MNTMSNSTDNSTSTRLDVAARTRPAVIEKSRSEDEMRNRTYIILG
jgi:hypothetical protein